MCDTKGVIYEGRTEGMNPYKARFAVEDRARARWPRRWWAPTSSSGSPQASCVTPEMVQRHGAQPDHFRHGQSRSGDHLRRGARPRAPTPSWPPAARDYPNQVNNVLGFPFIFRGALDVRATTINDEMKLAATRALAALAKEDVPDSRAARLRRRPPGIRPRVHHSQAVRPARADLGGVGGGAGRHGDRRGAAAGGPRRSTARNSRSGWARRTKSCAA